MIDIRAMLLMGVQGFFILLGFTLCVVALFCALSIVCGVASGISKRLKEHNRED